MRILTIGSIDCGGSSSLRINLLWQTLFEVDDCDDCLYLLVSGRMRTEPRAKLVAEALGPAAAAKPAGAAAATAAPAAAALSAPGLARPPPPSRRPPPASYVPVPMEGEVHISLDEGRAGGGGAAGAAGVAGAAGGGQSAGATLLSTAMERGTTFGEMALLYPYP
jgi:hypothetical protein